MEKQQVIDCTMNDIVAKYDSNPYIDLINMKTIMNAFDILLYDVFITGSLALASKQIKSLEFCGEFESK